VRRAPGFPCALCFQGDEVHEQLGRNAPRERRGVSSSSPRKRGEVSLNAYAWLFEKLNGVAIGLRDLAYWCSCGEDVVLMVQSAENSQVSVASAGGPILIPGWTSSSIL
jgi:hypothetical protein